MADVDMADTALAESSVPDGSSHLETILRELNELTKTFQSGGVSSDHAGMVQLQSLVQRVAQLKLSEEEIRKQKQQEKLKEISELLQFYFGDANLTRDGFLRNRITSSSDGWVDLDLLLTFNKLRSLTTLAEEVASAVLAFPSELIELSEDHTKIHRRVSLPSSDDSTDRSVYVCSVPSDMTQFQLREWFSTCGKVLFVSLPLDKATGRVRGFAFVEFETVEAAQKAVETMHRQKEFKKIGVIPKAKWLEQRKERNARSHPPQRAHKKHHTSAEPRGELVFQPGVIVQLTNIAPNVPRTVVREFANHFGTVKYVDYTRNLPEGYFRFERADEAARCVQTINEGKLVLGTTSPHAELLTGDEEKAYWEAALQAHAAARQARELTTAGSEEGEEAASTSKQNRRERSDQVVSSRKKRSRKDRSNAPSHIKFDSEEDCDDGIEGEPNTSSAMDTESAAVPDDTPAG
eukprot:CAMPEP_0174240878 /NCGR_PEP_ID=MMETSP0417-20130205/20985_1 /TAXON_ID=242541 /ORGANISM="Mayorella sp, Strain BSH-02190019" /LENGTH=462 /DNA_ID=CAMNT_0015320043 /DNA_START=31 /DNA_END=1419 /DNA_ORIENTATION=+